MAFILTFNKAKPPRIAARPGGVTPRARSALPGQFLVLNSVDKHVLQVIKPLHNDSVWLFIPTIVITF